MGMPHHKSFISVIELFTKKCSGGIQTESLHLFFFLQKSTQTIDNWRISSHFFSDQSFIELFRSPVFRKSTVLNQWHY